MSKFTNLTKTIFSFFSSLGYEVYLEGQVLKGAKFPYITISYEMNDFGVDSLIQGKIWDKGTGRERISTVTDELSTIINNGIRIRMVDDKGYIYLRQGSPFVQPISDIEGFQVNYFNIIMKSFY